MTKWQDGVASRAVRRAAGALGGLLLTSGCAQPDPSAEFIGRMDRLPPEQRVPHYDALKARMQRPAPPVGSVAPDFTLPVAGGPGTITRSTFAPGKPQVLVFGSWT